MMTRCTVAGLVSSTNRHPARIGFFLVCILCVALVAPGSADSSISVPLGSSCLDAGAGGGAVLSAGLGESLDPTEVVDYGEGATLTGDLFDSSGRGVPNALICIYSGVVTDEANELIGLVQTD